MQIEKLKVLVTLKAGDKVFKPGIYNEPIPKELVTEARSGTGNVEILLPVLSRDLSEKEREKREGEIASFTNHWMGMESDYFRDFVSVEENRNKIILHGQVDRAKAKWFRLFPTEPFPGEEAEESAESALEEEPSVSAPEVEQVAEEQETPKEVEQPKEVEEKPKRKPRKLKKR